MENLSIRKMLSWAAVLLWMALIFSLSHQPASESGEMSSGITEMVMETVEQILPVAETDFDQFEHIVRKNAHFFIYLILGILVIHASRGSGSHSFKRIGLAVGICILYALSDEFHQLFIDGRSGEFRDVLIDSSGASLGIILYWFAGKMLRRNKQNVLHHEQVQG
ncbi:VanZ like family protein [Planococcus glaciei]|uniref:VanZ family protein n=1 Tax=Planococcus glaciei TaxID=459472 RepID=UPI00087FC636|nr:VanZ family protein [Planococcus glaciei]SDI35525.1 VanZ like family protein [Planococcus glaciei]